MVRRSTRWDAASPGVWPFLLILAILAMAGYANIYSCPFVFDSEFRIGENWRIRQLWPPWNWLTYSQRPVAYVTFALNYAWHRYELAGYHATNLAIHTIAAWLLFGIVRRTLSLPTMPPRYRASAAVLAFAVAALWVAHPIQTQAVTYTVQRIESLMGLFFLLTLYLLLIAQVGKHPWAWYFGSVVACWLGMATKEVAAMAPLIVLWYDRVFLATSWRQLWQLRYRYYVGLFSGWLLLAALISQLGNYEAAAGSVEGLSPIRYALSQPAVLVHYLRLCFWPVGQCLDYGWPAATTAMDVVPYALFIGVLLAVTGWCLVKHPRLSIPGVWFFLILAPTSTVMPIRDLAFEHRMYLPLAAVAVGVVLAVFEISLRFWPRQINTMVIIFTVLVVVPLTVQTYQRNMVYASAESVWRDVVRKAPHNPRGHNNLGVQLFARGDLESATESFQTALELDTDYVDALTNLGAVFVQQQKLSEAMQLWRRAIALDPTFVGAYYNLGKAFRSLGSTNEAIEQFTEALAIDPQHARTHNELGTALAETGQVEAAIDHFERALRIDPAAAKTHYNLATALQFEVRDVQRAMVHYQAALELDNNYAAAHRGMATALIAMGNIEQATVHLRTAMQLNPDDPRTREILKLLNP